MQHPAPAEPAPRTDRDVFGRSPTRHPDWSHRRGEPRVFALLWMLYLMGVTGMMFASLSDAHFVSPSITRPAARAMVLATTAGLVLFWPALRLCQHPPHNPVRSAVRDLFVLLIPAQAVVWPHALPVLADWPGPVLLAVAATMGAWSLVVAGLIALADAGPRAGRARGWWMALVLGVVLGAPAFALATARIDPAPPDAPRPGWMASPLTAIAEVTRERSASGTLTPVSGTHWRTLGAAACAGAALLCLAGASGVAARRGEA